MSTKRTVHSGKKTSLQYRLKRNCIPPYCCFSTHSSTTYSEQSRFYIIGEAGSTKPYSRQEGPSSTFRSPKSAGFGLTLYWGPTRSISILRFPTSLILTSVVPECERSTSPS